MSVNYGSDKQPTECICPKCGEIHVMFLFWTGEGMPKKFCGKHECLLVENTEESYRPNYGRRGSIKGAL